MRSAGRLPGNDAPPGVDWYFPDSEAKDLAARIFGDANNVRGTRERFNIISSMFDNANPIHIYLLTADNFQYLDNFRPSNGRGRLISKGVETLSETDLVSNLFHFAGLLHSGITF